MTKSWLDEAEELRDELVAIRRDLHAHPELAFQEVRTAGIVAGRLGELGYEVVTGVGKTGVVGLLAGEQSGDRTVLIRFDMDALPIHEENDVPYRSQAPGVMHACGHDAHVAVGLGVAKLLSRRQGELRGTVKLMFQPAEEIGRGALAMIADGVLDGPPVDLALGLHVSSMHPIGTAVVHDGPLLAGADLFEIVVRGRGGHGARPHDTVDAVLVASQIVVALQSIVGRNVNPMDEAVVTIGSIHAGEAGNVIAETATMRGTLRSYKAEVHGLLRQRVQELASGIAASFGATAEVTTTAGLAPTVNAPGPSEVVRRVAGSVLGEDKINTTWRTMGGEDFGAVLAKVPGSFFMLGARNDERGLNYAHHNPRFDIDDSCLPAGVAILCESAARCLEGEG